jgi:hypothetical protein
MAGAKVGIKLMTVVIGIPVGIATRKLVERTWRSFRPDSPAPNAAATGVKWSDAIGYAALTAAGLAVTDLVARRGAAVAYEAITGNSQPSPGNGPKAARKAGSSSA